jgi:hypothetical protein
MEKDKDFDSKVLKLVAAELYFLAGMTAAREMYAKSYFSLGAGEKQSVDSAVWSQIYGNFQLITPQLLGEQTEAPKVGFHPVSGDEKQQS